MVKARGPRDWLCDVGNGENRDFPPAAGLKRFRSHGVPESLLCEELVANTGIVELEVDNVTKNPVVVSSLNLLGPLDGLFRICFQALDYHAVGAELLRLLSVEMLGMYTCAGTVRAGKS